MELAATNLAYARPASAKKTGAKAKFSKMENLARKFFVEKFSKNF